MKHTELYNEYKKLDTIEAVELILAVEAHGNEYVFIHFDNDGDYDVEERDNAPIIAASTQWMDAYEDFYVSRVEVDKGFYTLYGWPKEGCADEVEIDSVAHGHLGFVTDCIPETENVKDVSTSSDRDELYNTVRNLSEMLGEIAEHDDWAVEEQEINTLYELASKARDLMENGNV